MQVPDDKKRRRICRTAAALFEARPYHKVRLEEIASRAGVGKGTLYVYFPSKEALYVGMLEEAFTELIEQLRQQIDRRGKSIDALRALRCVVKELVGYAMSHPRLFEMMRSGDVAAGGPAWLERRQQLVGVIERLIREGVAEGQLHDPHPELTARFIPGMVRSVMVTSTSLPSARCSLSM